MTEAEVQQVEVEKERKALALAYKRVAMTDDGKKILKDLSLFCHAESSCLNEQTPDPYQMFHESGKRRVWLRISSYLKERKDG